MLRVKERGDGRRRDSEPRADRRGAGLRPADARARRISTEVQQLDLERARHAAGDADDALLALLASPTIASKRWVYRQYDHMVRTNTHQRCPGMGAGVVRIKGTDRALAMSVDGNGRYCYLDPHRGAMLAVAEAARNVACAGAQPLGATNCLNFGNPERPAIMWQFAQAVEGHRRGVPRARHADHRRQRQPVQRDRRHARSIRRRSSASSGCSSTPIASSAARFQAVGRRRSCCSARAAASSAAAST